MFHLIYYLRDYHLAEWLLTISVWVLDLAVTGFVCLILYGLLSSIFGSSKGEI
jgi:hypothetical protein